MKAKITTINSFVFTSVILLFSSVIYAQQSQPTDHFRSCASGDWSNISNWQSSSNGTSWYNATMSPTAQCASVLIRANDSIVINNVSSIVNVTVEEDGVLTFNSNVTVSSQNNMPGLVVFGRFHLRVPSNQYSNPILIKSGGIYIHHMFNNSTVFNCIWEDGSTLRLTDMNGATSLKGLNQNFYNVYFDGIGQNNDIYFEFDNTLNIRGDFTIIQSGSKLFLVKSGGNKTINVSGNFTLKKKSYVAVNNFNNIIVNVGNLLIGDGGTLLNKFELGTSIYQNNQLNLEGNLTVLSNGAINGQSTSSFGTICFNNAFKEQTVTRNGTIKNVNYLLKEYSCVTAPSITIDPGYMLTIENGASLKTESQINGTVQYRTTNADWLASMDGWHLLSSPVNNQLLTNGGFLTDPFDFYAWRESDNLWLNQKDATNNITVFQPGKGYFVAYDNGGTKSFSGSLNNADVILTGLTLTGNSAHAGFQLLGNPFPCSLDWNSSSWNKTSVNAIAQIWNEEARNYIPLTVDNGLIPPQSGFFIQVTSPTSFTIPRAARTHKVNSTLKDVQSGLLRLRITGVADSCFDETVIRLYDDASTGFDAYDGIKLEGSSDAPQICTTLTDGLKLCVNSFPADNYPTTIPLYVRSGAEGVAFLQATVNTMNEDVYLENLSSGSMILLKQGEKIGLSPASLYNLHFSSLGKSENDRSHGYIYASGERIYFRGIPVNSEFRLYDIIGNLVVGGTVGDSNIESVNPDVKPGIYIISVLNSDLNYSQKIILN